MSLSDVTDENVEDTAKPKDKEPDIVDEIVEHLGLSEPPNSKTLTKLIADRLQYELLITFIIFIVSAWCLFIVLNILLITSG